MIYAFPGHHFMALARIAVAGTSGFIGAAVCEALVEKYEVVALTRSMARPGQAEPRHRIQLRACDHYSRKELEVALQGVDYGSTSSTTGTPRRGWIRPGRGTGTCSWRTISPGRRPGPG